MPCKWIVSLFTQLQAVAGGERMQLAPGVVLRTYPALHCLMPFSRACVDGWGLVN